MLYNRPFGFQIDWVTKRAKAAFTPDTPKHLAEGKAVLATHGSHTHRSLHSFYRTINALASLQMPAATFIYAGDKPAGELVRQVTEGVTRTFGEDLADLIVLFEGLHAPGLPGGWTLHDVISVYYELDWQAQNGGPAVGGVTPADTFADLSLSDQDKLWKWAKSLDSNGDTVPDYAAAPSTIPVSQATFTIWYNIPRLLGNWMWFSGYPHNRYFTGATGWGPTGPLQINAGFGYGATDQPILTDETNKIARPDGPGTFLRFLDWQYPEQHALHLLRVSAFIEANVAANAVQSEADFAALKALYYARGYRDYTGI